MVKQKKSTIRYLKQKQTKESRNEKGPKDTAAPKEGKVKLPKQKTARAPRDSNMVDVDVETEDTVISMNTGSKQSKNSAARHQEELDALKEKDPDFFQFLQQNDANLLDFEDEEDLEEDESDGDSVMEFGSDEEVAADDDDEDDEEDLLEDDDDMEGVEEDAAPVAVEVTSELLESFIAKAKAGSFSSLKRILGIFKAACIPASDSDNASEGQMSLGKYLVNSPDIYEQTMIGVIDAAHSSFYMQLDMPGGFSSLDISKLEDLEKSKKWKKIQLLVLSFFKSILHMLASLADNSSGQGEVTAYIIASLEYYLPLLAPMPRLTKAVLKVLLGLWAQKGQSSESAPENFDVRIQAFLRVRQISMSLPGAATEESFRAIYLTFTRHCKTFNEHSSSGIVFMSQCIVELYTTDVMQAYQHAFLYIRQLALQLRTTMMKKTSEMVRQVASWQYINCIRLWVRVICAMPAATNAELGELAFPLSQIIFGTMAVAPSTFFLPCRFHLINCLQQLSANCKVFIPTISKLMEILECPELHSKPTPSTEVAPKLAHIVKFGTDAVNRVVVRDTIVLEVISLIRQEAEIYRYHVGLPEYLYIALKKLKAFAKKCKISKWRDMIRVLISQLEEFSEDVKKDRSKLIVSPLEITDFEPLLPMGMVKASERLNKLLKQRSTGAFGASDMDISGSKVAAGKGKFAAVKGKQQKDADESSDDDDEDDQSDEEDEESEEEAQPIKKGKTAKVTNTKQQAMGKNIEDMQDKVQDMSGWSDSSDEGSDGEDEESDDMDED